MPVQKQRKKYSNSGFFKLLRKMSSPPDEFPFPFQPYDIQHDFMTNLYTVLESKKLGIFESPTGTGKSQSIICGSLKWLTDHNAYVRNALNNEIQLLDEAMRQRNNSTDDWIASQFEDIKLNRQRGLLDKQKQNINEHDDKINKIMSRKKQQQPRKAKTDDNTKQDVPKTTTDVDDDDEVLLDEPDDNSEEYDTERDDDDDEEKHCDVQIFICSRTHSQLSQLAKEITKSPYGKDVRVVTLASRQSYCINPGVSSLKTGPLINQRCIDLQKVVAKATRTDGAGRSVKRSKSTCEARCTYLKPTAVEALRDVALIEVRDVEDLVADGKELHACPYYASRLAVKDAQIVLVPYNTLLHRSTRNASGIKLKNNVVIIDEAHNVVDAVTQMYGAKVEGLDLLYSQSRLVDYKKRYNMRLSAKNLLCLNQLLFIVDKLVQFLAAGASLNSETSTATIQLPLQFVSNADIDVFNLYKLLTTCRNNNIAYKVHGLAQTTEGNADTLLFKKPDKGVKAYLDVLKRQKNSAKSESQSGTSKATLCSFDPSSPSRDTAATNVLLPVLAFLDCLADASDVGRVVCERGRYVQHGSLKYVLLNPAVHFKDIVADARAVVVAGGTMKPIEEFKNRLFMAAGAPEERIHEFSCGHVVPQENVLPIVVARGPNGTELNFSFKSRKSTILLDQLGNVLLNVSSIVPAGIVCFFVSYDYEQFVYSYLKKKGYVDKISKRKRMFREPKSSSDVDKVLADYAKCIRMHGKESDSNKITGAILFSVVGGKLSEGLNFNDDLGRCVIVVGMPYANIESPELINKMVYWDVKEGVGAGKTFYKNICMKAVNQCIGRAVRHKADYATIILLDCRYLDEKVHTSLPNWISKSLLLHQQYKRSQDAIINFFESKKKLPA